MAITDHLRAAVYARDKAICSFSGLSVWMLDYGTAPFYHPDWVDHVKPKSRGGSDKLDNLVCASYFYNQKKKHNGADNSYLFSEGRPTDQYFWVFGRLSAAQAELLKRHSRIELSDWYFNRAIFNVMVAVADRHVGADVSRNKLFWLKAAQKKIATWRKLTDGRVDSFFRRNLIRYPNASDTKWMLELAAAPDVKWPIIFDRLAKHYGANVRAMEAFLDAPDRKARLRILERSRQDKFVTSPVLEAISANVARIR